MAYLTLTGEEVVNRLVLANFHRLPITLTSRYCRRMANDGPRLIINSSLAFSIDAFSTNEQTMSKLSDTKTKEISLASACLSESQ